MSEAESPQTSVLARLIVVGFVLLFLMFFFGVIFPIELLLVGAFGWIWFLIRVAPEIRLDWSSTALAATALGCFGAGLHWFLTWLTPHVLRGDFRWRLRWTFCAVAVIVMMFIAGISMVGIAHQVCWLARSDEPIIGSGFMAAHRMRSSNHLKQIGLGIQNYHDTFQALPLGATFNRDGQALHSWQTRLLPFCEATTRGEIDWDQPWNAPSNREQFKTIIRFYQMPYLGLPKVDENGYALSHYAANQQVIAGTANHGFGAFSDGLSNTILCGEAAGNYKPWGNPINWRDPAVGINASPDGFGSPLRGGCTFVFADGHTAFITNKTDPKILRALSTPDGGEPIGDY